MPGNTGNWYRTSENRHRSGPGQKTGDFKWRTTQFPVFVFPVTAAFRLRQIPVQTGMRNITA